MNLLIVIFSLDVAWKSNIETNKLYVNVPQILLMHWNGSKCFEVYDCKVRSTLIKFKNDLYLIGLLWHLSWFYNWTTLKSSGFLNISLQTFTAFFLKCCSSQNNSLSYNHAIGIKRLTRYKKCVFIWMCVKHGNDVYALIVPIYDRFFCLVRSNEIFYRFFKVRFEKFHLHWIIQSNDFNQYKSEDWCHNYICMSCQKTNTSQKIWFHWMCVRI